MRAYIEPGNDYIRNPDRRNQGYILDGYEDFLWLTVPFSWTIWPDHAIVFTLRFMHRRGSSGALRRVKLPSIKVTVCQMGQIKSRGTLLRFPEVGQVDVVYRVRFEQD